VARVVEIPVPVQQSTRALHAIVERGARIGRQDVKGRRLDALADRPVDRALEDVGVVSVHPEHEAAVDHDTVIVEPPDGRIIVAVEILELALLAEIRGAQRLEPDEKAAQASGRGALEQAWTKHGLDRGGRLPHSAHSLHAIEQRRREPHVAEEMIVEKVEMSAGQSVDLGQRIIDGLGIESAPVREKRLLVAEIARVRAPARDDDGVGDEIEVPPDQVAPDAREAFERSDR
jgi:hypothetical protein